MKKKKARPPLTKNEVTLIKELLSKKTLTHEEIAQRVGVSRGTVGHIKAGRQGNRYNEPPPQQPVEMFKVDEQDWWIGSTPNYR